MIKYKSYGKLPSKLYGIEGSFFNKPLKGLWGCRGEEWKDWCVSEQFQIHRLNKCFYFRLKPHTRILRIKYIQNFIDLCIEYGDEKQCTIDFMKLAEDYDAVEIVGDIVYTLRHGFGFIQDEYMYKLYNKYQHHPKFEIMQRGLYAWDIPSICVLNPNVVKLYMN